MKSTDAPGKQAVPFGANGPREAITATTPSGSNQASYDQGFPPITMTLKNAGGLPPKGQDMNQILFEQSSFNRYFSAGGTYTYDQAFSSLIGGYPSGARIPNSTKSGFWINTIDDNTANPENSSGALTGWVPIDNYGYANIPISSASVTASSLQAAKDKLILNGALTSNVNLILPAWSKRWNVVNNCTGGFNVTVKTPSGSGISIPTGYTAQLFGDGTSIYLDNSSIILGGTPTAPTASAGTSNNQLATTEFAQALTGKLIGRQIFTASGSYTPTPGTKFIIVEAVGGGGSGASSSAANGSQSSVGGSGGPGAYAKVIYYSPSAATVTIGFAGPAGTVAGSAGNAGGNTTMVGSGFSLNCVGGSGGSASVTSAATFIVQGKAASSATQTGGISFTSHSGVWSTNGIGLTPTTCRSGTGGTSLMGTGADGVVGGAGLSPYSGFGGGGSGAVSLANGIAYPGGAGYPGCLIVWEYS